MISRLRNGAGGEAFEPTPRPDLQEVLEHYGAHAYHSGKIVCVFHEDTTPSLSVDLEKQVFKCFACSAAGDAFTAIMLREDLDFAGATEFAKTAGFGAGEVQKKEEPSVFGRKRPGRAGKGEKHKAWTRPW